ncbi:hypothetical protein PAE9249_04259 [Paenibacillus sp. CECT 9249]|uniref:glycoside hydrolase family 15 protein n=1 Tax=Paenibacillus sp. CECT 9249 TaxID=2845385 RepID=UPI001E47F901|nr:glycoside hydrolase family 15 protein [Paenibacillus sp. CECT 9249]CAH0121726.1 hypothetical protein PAE9249_04259 [Paenibacillus sp. CECT 9249]
MNTYLDKKPYLIDAVIGNSRFLASLTKTGRMVRLWWPHVDIAQHVETIRSGIRLDGVGGKTSWFDGEEDGWKHAARYVPQTNIFAVAANSDRCPISVETHYYVVPGQDIVVFDYRFTNRGTEPVRFSFVFYSSLMIGENPFYHTSRFDDENDAMVHFRHQVFFMASGANVCTKYQACDAWDNAQNGALNGNNIQMAPDGAMEWEFAELAPGQTVTMPVYLTAGSSLAAAAAALQHAKSRTADQWAEQTAAYWKRFLQSAKPCPLPGVEINDLYERSLLAMKLMADEQSGSIIAAPEFDEHFSRCGGYAFCWGRDAAFITTALDKAGLTDLSTRFYDWALTAQDPDGSWQQRHYHDGSLAPSWGLQIDEGGSILWGMFEHYRALPERERDSFARKVWSAIKAGAQFLAEFIDEETGLPKPSNDLWEEREAEHTYSAAAVYAGLRAASRFAELMEEEELGAQWRASAGRISESIVRSCWNDDKGIFYRGVKRKISREQYEEALSRNVPVSLAEDGKGYPICRLQYDDVVDVSLLGVSMPFAVISPDHPYAVRTADTIEQSLTVSGVGGIRRYEDDVYIGGNPWILTTLWLAQYRAVNGQTAEARALLQWAIDHRTEMGLLPEQVDRETGETAWVVPLTWSHAMFILTVHLLAEQE